MSFRTHAVVFALAVACAPLATRAESSRVREARILILSTMLADAGVGEWGFAALVEVDGRKVLFDTGAYPDTVLRNAKRLGVDLSTIEEVVLSHNHADHTGGLVAIRSSVVATNSKAISRIHVGKGIFEPRRGKEGDKERNLVVTFKDELVATGATFIEHDGPFELAPGVWLTGPVPRKHPEKNWTAGDFLLRDGKRVEDDLPEDMSLVLDTDSGLVVLSGCGHAGIVNTLEHARAVVRPAKIHAAIGGFHLFDADDEKLTWTASKLREFGLEQFVGAHCTGIEATFELRKKCGLERKTCVVGAVGASFTLGKGIDPRKLAR